MSPVRTIEVTNQRWTHSMRMTIAYSLNNTRRRDQAEVEDAASHQWPCSGKPSQLMQAISYEELTDPMRLVFQGQPDDQQTNKHERQDWQESVVSVFRLSDAALPSCHSKNDLVTNDSAGPLAEHRANTESEIGDTDDDGAEVVRRFFEQTRNNDCDADRPRVT
jgi:hypothetical protein